MATPPLLTPSRLPAELLNSPPRPVDPLTPPFRVKAPIAFLPGIALVSQPWPLWTLAPPWPTSQWCVNSFLPPALCNSSSASPLNTSLASTCGLQPPLSNKEEHLEPQTPSLRTVSPSSSPGTFSTAPAHWLSLPPPLRSFPSPSERAQNKVNPRRAHLVEKPLIEKISNYKL